MVICTQLKNANNEFSIEYAYTSNEISYQKDIEKIEIELLSENDSEIIARKQNQLKTLKQMKYEEQVAFLTQVDSLASLLENLLFGKKIKN